MDLQNILENLVEECGFAPEEKEDVAIDLVNAINLNFLSGIQNDPQNAEKISSADQLLKDGKGAEALTMIEELKKDDDLSNKYKASVSEVLKDWFSEISSSIPEEKRQSLIEKLQKVNQE